MASESEQQDEIPAERQSSPPVNDDDSDEEERAPQDLPPRREHKYTTANLRPERPWKRYLLSALACIVMIVIMVLLSLFLQKLFDPPEDEDWSEDKPVNTTVTTDDDAGGAGVIPTNVPPLLPKRSDFLEDVCAEDKIDASSTSRTACEDVCAPAMDCCDPFAGGNSTCFEEHVAGCVTYSQCHALVGAIDPAYNDLDRVCSEDAIQEKPEDCEFACTAVSCCYTDVNNCVANNFQACLDYAPCQNYKGIWAASQPGETETQLDDENYIFVAEPGLDDECRDGDAMCARECRKASSCCNDVSSKCYRDNFVACLTYATCNQYPDTPTTITVAPIHSRVPAAPDNLRRVCIESYVMDNGNGECQSACTNGACCFEEGAANCFGDDPLGCMEYRMCAIVK